jgi:hypothetical protein
MSTTPPGDWPPTPGQPDPSTPPPGQPTPPGSWGGVPGQATPPPYGAPPAAPGYGYAQPQGYGYGYAREHPDGGTVLVLGILSLVICGLLGPFAWSKGNSALREIDAHPGQYTNRGAVNAGRICGMISSILLIVGVGFFLLLIIGGALAGSSSGT